MVSAADRRRNRFFCRSKVKFRLGRMSR